MRTSLAYVETIKSLKPIPGADKIECATILGFEVVVKKGQFSIGDKCIYIEIDSLLPKIPYWDFMIPRKHRVKIIKLKNQVSQGLVIPLSALEELDVNKSFNISKLNVGDDVTELLQITKYDPESVLDIPVEDVKRSWWDNKVRYYKWKLFGIQPVKKGNFPSDVPKSDETRVQKMFSSLEKYEGQRAYISEKLDGTSSTFIYRKNGNWLSKLFGQDGIFQICSRNQIVYNSQNGKSPIAHHLVTIAEKYGIRNKLKKLNRNIAVQGETIGGKIQGNPYKLSDLEFKVFLMFDIDKQLYLPYHEMIALAKELDLQTVPIITDNHYIFSNINYYVDLSKGKSMLNPSVLKEGIVIRHITDNFSFKSISPDFLLAQKD